MFLIRQAIGPTIRKWVTVIRFVNGQEMHRAYLDKYKGKNVWVHEGKRYPTHVDDQWEYEIP